MEGRIGDRTVERCREAADVAFHKHGELSTDPVRACAILIRECGEALDAALEGTRPSLQTCPPGYQGVEKKIAMRHMYAELAQVAATAMVIMEQMEEGE